jgi:transmembrane sensor
MNTWNEEAVGMDALEIESCASEWIERRSFGVWDAREDTELNAWRAQSLAHEIAFLRLEAGWARTERLLALRPKQFERAAAPKTTVGGKYLNRAIAIAAALVILGTAGWAYLIKPTSQTYSTPIGGRKTVAFADGSKIELNTDTLIRAREDRLGREVDLLKGEVYFQIKHNPAKPFIVTAAGHRLTDLGTKFLVRSDSGRLKVSLLEGRVELASSDVGIAPHSAVLAAGDVAIANAKSLSVLKKPSSILIAELGWRSGVLVFQDTPLVAAAAEFNRYNRRKLVIADIGAGKRIIGATFPADRVDLFANAVRNVLGLRVEERADQIIISR